MCWQGERHKKAAERQTAPFSWRPNPQHGELARAGSWPSGRGLRLARFAAIPERLLPFSASPSALLPSPFNFRPGKAALSGGGAGGGRITVDGDKWFFDR